MTSDPKRSHAMPIDGPGTRPDSLEALYLTHAAALRGRMLVLTRDPAVANDLASEAFLRLALELAAAVRRTTPGRGSIASVPTWS